MEYMLTFHILNVYVDKTRPRQFKFTFNTLYSVSWRNRIVLFPCCRNHNEDMFPNLSPIEDDDDILVT